MNKTNTMAPAQRDAKPMSLSAVFATPKFQEAIHNALNDAAHEKRFVAAVISAVAVNPVLQQCTPASVLSAALLGESLKLSPSPQLGQYYMVPYKETVKDRNGRNTDRKVERAQFQIGYKGYIQLALRSGYYKKLNVMSVKATELKHWDPLNEEIDLKLIEDDDKRESAPTIGYYAMFEYLNGFKKAMYWGREKMERHALRFSKGYAAKKGYTFWEKDFDAMAYKTMLRQLISKWGVMTVDLQTAFENDIVAEQGEDGEVHIVDTGDTPEPSPFPDAQDAESEPAEEEQPPVPDHPTTDAGEVNIRDL